MFNALNKARSMPRARRPLKTWQAALIGLAVCTPSVAVAVQAWAEPAPMQVAAPFASSRLSVEVVGQGPDVILIPGFASSREVWRAEAERLKATHRVHLVQLAGFAGEAWTHGDAPVLQPAVDEIVRYIADQRLQAPAVIGHSMGGLTALLIAQQHPEAISKAMTVDSLPFFSALFGPQITIETARPFADQAAAGMLAAGEDAFRVSQAQGAPGLSRDPETQRLMVEWSLAGDRRAMATAISEVMTTDARPGLAGLRVPVWAPYASDANGGAPAAMADAMWTREYAGAPNIRLIRVDDSRHFIMADQPQRFAQIVDQFLAD